MEGILEYKIGKVIIMGIFLIWAYWVTNKIWKLDKQV